MKKITTQVDKHIFFDESGTGGDNTYLGLGVIVCTNPARIHEKLDVIRKKHNYFNEIKFEKMSKKRFKICKLFLQVLRSEQAVFKAVIVNKKQVGIEHFDYKHWARFNTLADDLINGVVEENETIHIYADEKTSPAEDNFSEYLLTHVIGTQEVIAVNSKAYDLIQLCDLILGAIRASYEKVVKNQYKKQLVTSINRFPKQKVIIYEYKLKSGQPSKTESDRKS